MIVVIVLKLIFALKANRSFVVEKFILLKLARIF